MTAIETLLVGMFDYAGLYPPASLSLRSAANNYLDYSRGKHSALLGRFIINADRLKELRSVAGESLHEFKLSVIVSDMAEFETIADEIREGMPVESLEIKPVAVEAIRSMALKVPPGIPAYLELPFNAGGVEAIRAIVDAGMKAKIRMGGVVAEAIPAVPDVAHMLMTFAKNRRPFKATAGLHHPIRSHRPLTYQQQSATGAMHGFINLCCAAAALFFGGDAREAEKVLLETEPSAWNVGPNFMQWRDLRWTQDQLSTVRREFLMSIGTCSFEEPIQDLRSLGWL